MLLCRPQNMPSENAISGLFESEQDKKALFTCLSLTFFLMLLEAFFDNDFSCPCDVELNATMINLIFAGPFLFVFALVLYISITEIDSRLQLVKIVLLCLLPPLVWIALVFLDGDYVACKKTYWKGLYVYDDQHHFKWCKPTESVPGKNDTELLALTLGFVAESQVSQNSCYLQKCHVKLFKTDLANVLPYRQIILQ